ncbi:uncharacterized protein K441DRAFT_663576 [Cenococcum geophilum 1.58]|uniref:uncharacterized protein n=1 Tax=Cenococcum geophilum 1.58 TaxID=794803 RepID=UPI00358F4745|nr:hypothetical protein K441DRAFT_663576 [Cenococcum geophilum 1.58]
MLNDPNVEKQHGYTGPLLESERNKYSFRKSESEMSITLYGPIPSYPVPRINKTAAVLDRGNQFPRISSTSGWGADALPLNDKTGPTWIERVYSIARTVGYRFPEAPDSLWDHGKPGQYFASHAEKKLIAYFINRHVFMPQDKEPDQKLEGSIYEVESSLADGKNSSVAWAKVCQLEERKAKLDLELFDADDRLQCDSYDEQEVKRLKHEIHVIDEQLLCLESDADLAKMRAQEKMKRILLKRNKTHHSLMELTRNEPSIMFMLKRAVILSSNAICENCDMFKKRVNGCFQLNIEMRWCA